MESMLNNTKNQLAEMQSQLTNLANNDEDKTRIQDLLDLSMRKSFIELSDVGRKSDSSLGFEMEAKTDEQLIEEAFGLRNDARNSIIDSSLGAEDAAFIRHASDKGLQKQTEIEVNITSPEACVTKMSKFSNVQRADSTSDVEEEQAPLTIACSDSQPVVASDQTHNAKPSMGSPEIGVAAVGNSNNHVVKGDEKAPLQIVIAEEKGKKEQTEMKPNSSVADDRKGIKSIKKEKKSMVFGIFNSKAFQQSSLAQSTGNNLSITKLSPESGNQLIFHPHSIAIQIWNCIFSIVMAALLIFIPLILGFEKSFGYLLPVASVINTAFVCLDVLIKYHTGINIHQQIEVQPDKIRQYYFKNGSWIFDIITGFPWVFIIDAVTPENSVARSTARMICFVNASVTIGILFGTPRVSYLTTKAVILFRIYGVNSALIDSFKILVAMVLYW